MTLPDLFTLTARGSVIHHPRFILSTVWFISGDTVFQPSSGPFFVSRASSPILARSAPKWSTGEKGASDELKSWSASQCARHECSARAIFLM